MLFFYDNGKCAKVPLSSYETKQNRRKLLKAYSDKAELAFMRHLPEETELAIHHQQPSAARRQRAHTRKDDPRHRRCQRCGAEKECQNRPRHAGRGP